MIEVVAVFRNVMHIDKFAQLAGEGKKREREIGWHTDDLKGGDPRSE